MARKKTSEMLKPKIGEASLEDIAGLLAKGATGATPAGPVKRLHPRDIQAAEEGVFQFRRCERDPYRSGQHIEELTRALQIGGKPFEPLLVFHVGGEFFLMDGHHRLAAYEAAEWDKPVPVKVFQGSLEDARFAALGANSRDKLPMKPEDKLEAAWCLAKEEKEGGDWAHTKERLVGTELASNGTFGKMRSKWLEIKATGNGNLLGMTWAQAKYWTVGQEIEQDLDGWRERKIQEWVDRLITAGIAKGLAKEGEFVMEALCRVAPDLPSRAAGMMDACELEEMVQDRDEHAF